MKKVDLKRFYLKIIKKKKFEKNLQKIKIKKLTRAHVSLRELA
jgi:hypothetical protein